MGGECGLLSPPPPQLWVGHGYDPPPIATPVPRPLPQLQLSFGVPGTVPFLLQSGLSWGSPCVSIIYY